MEVSAATSHPVNERPFRALLVSTYDLGRQPFGVASLAAWLAREGFEVECLDLAVEAFDEARVERADAVLFFLPMHTATRLASQWMPRVRALKPEAAIAGFGLYAPANGDHLRGLGADALFGGEFEAEVTRWLIETRERRRLGQRAEARSSASFGRLAQYRNEASVSWLSGLSGSRSNARRISRSASSIRPNRVSITEYHRCASA